MKVAVSPHPCQHLLFSILLFLFLFAYSHHSLISRVEAARARRLIPTLVLVRQFVPSSMAVLGVDQQGSVGSAGLPLSRSATLAELWSLYVLIILSVHWPWYCLL